MKGSQKIKLDGVVSSIKISQITTKTKISQTKTKQKVKRELPQQEKSCQDFTKFSISWEAEKLSAVETPPQNLGQHSGSCPAVPKKFSPLFFASPSSSPEPLCPSLNSERFSAQEGGKKE